MTISQIEYFLEVAKTMNFHRAAENKYISQQVISRQIQALEQELDLKLFDRSNKRNLRLTEAGEILYEGWSGAYNELISTLEKARDQDKAKNDTVVLGIHAVSWVVDRAAELLQKFKQVNDHTKIETIVSGTAGLEEDLQNGKINLLLTFSTEMSAKEIQYYKLGKMNIKPAIIMAKTHVLADKKKLTIPDLCNETIYLLKNSYSKDASRRVLQEFEHYNVSPARIEYFDNTESMEAKLMMGEGVCVGFDLLFRNRNRLKMFYFDSAIEIEEPELVLCWKDPKYKKFAAMLI